MGKPHVLHNLIHSLSKSEKRFIRLNAQFHQGDKTYMKLFDAIEKQKKYDEEALKVKFRNEKFILTFAVLCGFGPSCCSSKIWLCRYGLYPIANAGV